MTTPFAHTHVSHVSRIGRRRSHSLSLPNSDEEDATGRSLRRKQFLTELQKERQNKKNNHEGQHKEQHEKQKEHSQDKDDHHQAIVIRVPGAHNTPATKKHTSSAAAIPVKKQLSTTISKTSAPKENEQHRPVVSRVGRTATTRSMKKYTSSTEAISTALKTEVISVSSNNTHSEEDEEHHGNQPQIIRIPKSESTMSLKQQLSTETFKSSNVNVFTTLKNQNLNSSATLKGIYCDSSQTSSNPFVSSSMNLMSKSKIFDQDFYLDDGKAHLRRNDAKRHGKINKSGGEKYLTNYDRKLAARSSASFMAATIAIVIGIIAFAFALASLILVLLLRSTVATVETKLVTISATLNFSSSSSSSSLSGSGSWPSACSAYTDIDDLTRSVNAPGYALGCDNTAPFINRTIPVWIRFKGAGGTILPLTTPGMNICGSEGTGWYDGTMPSSPGQIVNGTACFTWYTNVCRYSQSISVANCDSFYIYLLPPAPGCMMRYCTI